MSTQSICYLFSQPLVVRGTDDEVESVLDCGTERKIIQDVIAKAGLDVKFRSCCATIQNVDMLMKNEATVVHFAAHGMKGGKGITFESTTAETIDVSIADLSRYLHVKDESRLQLLAPAIVKHLGLLLLPRRQQSMSLLSKTTSGSTIGGVRISLDPFINRCCVVPRCNKPSTMLRLACNWKPKGVAVLCCYRLVKTMACHTLKAVVPATGSWRCQPAQGSALPVEQPTTVKRCFQRKIL